MVENPGKINSAAILGILSGVGRTESGNKQGFIPLGSQLFPLSGPEQRFVTLRTDSLQPAQPDQPLHIKGLSTPGSEIQGLQDTPRSVPRSQPRALGRNLPQQVRRRQMRRPNPDSR